MATISGRIGHKATPGEDAEYLLQCCANTLMRDYNKHQRRRILKNMQSKHGAEYVSQLKKKMMEIYDRDRGNDTLPAKR